MSAIIFLVVISIIVASLFVLLFARAVNKGQYNEFESPSIRVLNDDDLTTKTKKTK